MKCKVEDCDKSIFTKKSGLCIPHYKRQYRYGSPLLGQPPRLENIHDRFLQKIHVDNNGCWNWFHDMMSKGRGLVKWQL